MVDPGVALVGWLESLPVGERDELARRYRAASAAGGATILRPDGQVAPIPPLLTPESLDTGRLAAVEQNAHALLSALVRLTAWLMSDRGAGDRTRLFRAFGPFEAVALEKTWREAEHLA